MFVQLKLEQGEGRVFNNWQEGPIHFPPTYKYKEGTDQFSGEVASQGRNDDLQLGKSCHPHVATCLSPGNGSLKVIFIWAFLCRCDRILWYGKGLKQVAYTHGDLKLSDHRSVCAIFMAEVEFISHRKLKKACIYPKNIIMDTKEVLSNYFIHIFDRNICSFSVRMSTIVLNRTLLMNETFGTGKYQFNIEKRNDYQAVRQVSKTSSSK